MADTIVRGVRPLPALLLLAAVLPLGACGDDEGLPQACHASSDAVRTALSDAPDEVRVDGEAISGCVRQAIEAGELEVVGTAYVEAAEELAREAGADPGSPATVRLGYLVGAVRGAAEETGGLHDELRRRVEQAVSAEVGHSAGFERGERAGRESG